MKTIDPDELIALISEEFERNVAARSWRSGTKSSKGDDKDEAMSVVSSGKGKHFERKPRGVCWNCGEKGHFKDKCPKPVKSNDKKDDSPKKGGSANAAIESDSEDEAAFFAELWDSDSDMPELQSVSDSDSDSDLELEGDRSGDWFSEIGDDLDSDDTKELFGIDGSECGSLVSVDLNSVAVDLDEVAAHVESSSKAESSPRVKVYDSGCTRHITPYRDAVDNFIEISLKSFRAANKLDFTAVGMGEMTVDVPNGVDISQLRLTEVMYSPEVGYTLVSVGRLDENGFLVTFANGKCTIQGPEGEHIGAIQKMGRGLYWVAHEPEMANVTTEVLTLDQLHRRMGHISTEVVQKLIDKGFVTGVRLETTPSGEPHFCESCVYAKAMRKPVSKA